MIILMSRPWRHPQTAVWYFRCRLPSDLAPIDGGARMSVDVAGTTTTIKLAPILKVSLRTKDIGEARLRHASVQQQFERRWTT